MGFWLQALGAARVAIAKMEAAGVPWRRPPDYYAEMVKTDDHMLKVREQLAFEQKQIEEAGQRWASVLPLVFGHVLNWCIPLVYATGNTQLDRT